FAPLHLDQPRIRVRTGFARPRAATETGGHAQLAGIPTVRVQVTRDHAVSVFAALLHDHGASAVSEDDGPTAVLGGALPRLWRRLAIRRAFQNVPVSPRHEAGVCFRTDNENGASGVRAQKR